MNATQHQDNTLLDIPNTNIPNGMAAIHTSSLHGDLKEVLHFDAIGDALHRRGISYRIEFSRDRSTRTIFVQGGDKARGLEAANRVANGSEVTTDRQDDIRDRYNKKIASVLANAV